MDHEVTPVNPQQLLMVLVSAIGLFYIYSAITDAIYWVTLLLMANEANSLTYGQIELQNDMWASMALTVFELLISFGLVFKSKTIANMILKITR